ncbi:MAG: hypothetical protein ACFFDW_15175 [Candidatus Thorarchaeota archaeon]
MMRNYNSLLLIILLSFSFLMVNISYNTSLSEQDIGDKEKQIDCDKFADLVKMDYFPVDLDYLFFADNYTAQRERLNFLGNDSYGFMVTPWGGHFVGGHIEGNDKWYITPWRQAEIRAPQAGTVSLVLVENGTFFEKNGQETMLGMGVYIDIGNGCTLGFGHMDLLKSIYDEYQLGNTITLAANQLIGYTHNFTGVSGLDFYYWYNWESICPYVALNDTLKTTFDYYYAMQYETCKLAGTYPETNICNSLDVAIENTCWGVWYYNHGPFDDIFYQTTDIGTYDFAFVDFFNINKTNPETFHKDFRNRTLDLPPNLAGIFVDNLNGVDIPEYNYIGVSYATLVSGNYKDGLLRIDPYYPNPDWGVDTIYAKYYVVEGDEGPEDDMLRLEYFTSETEANLGFTENNMTYLRYYTYVYEPSTNKVGIRNTPLLELVIMGMIFISIFQKKRK